MFLLHLQVGENSNDLGPDYACYIGHFWQALHDTSKSTDSATGTNAGVITSRNCDKGRKEQGGMTLKRIDFARLILGNERCIIRRVCSNSSVKKCSFIIGGSSFTTPQMQQCNLRSCPFLFFLPPCCRYGRSGTCF